METEAFLVNSDMTALPKEQHSGGGVGLSSPLSSALRLYAPQLGVEEPPLRRGSHGWKRMPWAHEGVGEGSPRLQMAQTNAGAA